MLLGLGPGLPALDEDERAEIIMRRKTASRNRSRRETGVKRRVLEETVAAAEEAGFSRGMQRRPVFNILRAGFSLSFSIASLFSLWRVSLLVSLVVEEHAGGDIYARIYTDTGQVTHFVN